MKDRSVELFVTMVILIITAAGLFIWSDYTENIKLGGILEKISAVMIIIAVAIGIYNYAKD